MLNFPEQGEILLKDKGRKLFNVKDTIIIALIIAAVFAFYASVSGSEGENAVVLCGGSIIAEFPLNTAGEYFCPEVPDMTFTVADGTVSVTESGCGDKICVHTGKISHKGEAIICVPNRVVVEIKGNTSKGGVDAVL